MNFNVLNELIISDSEDFKYYLFKYNEDNIEFEEVTVQNSTTYSSAVQAANILGDFLFVTTEANGLFVYRYENQEVVFRDSIFFIGTYFLTHAVSSNRRVLVAGGSGFAHFFLNCTYDSSTGKYFDIVFGGCLPCISNCRYCNSYLRCIECDEDYYLDSNQICLLNESSTPSTNTTNETNTTNSTLTNTSSLCFIPNCVSCINDTHCSECDNETSLMRLEEGRCCKWTDSCHDLFWVLLVFPIASVALVGGVGVVVVLKVKGNGGKMFPE